ncbi:hypothetical protein THAOC_25800 [Thalassiosira oceanica]|uniref:Uncharacterized protein n=1 Tax=Thalassiosira oceanica TaxID=159749 RepID=K0RN44_THAOC|nr:hypothetical protein THAOC_25800 [Thalassiosira oceanica]|eukprot:EJK54560.1 hypothetical protein THAOC_25800 [Thalassiosira oceanica]
MRPGQAGVASAPSRRQAERVRAAVYAEPRADRRAPQERAGGLAGRAGEDKAPPTGRRRPAGDACPGRPGAIAEGSVLDDGGRQRRRGCAPDARRAGGATDSLQQQRHLSQGEAVEEGVLRQMGQVRRRAVGRRRRRRRRLERAGHWSSWSGSLGACQVHDQAGCLPSLAFRCRPGARQGPGGSVGGEQHVGCIEFDESDPSGYSDRAQASMRMGNDNDAIVDLTRAISLDPKNAGAHAERARLCHKHGQYESAVADFEKAHALDPSAGYDRLAGVSNHEMIGEMRESQTFHSLTIEEVDGDEDECERERSLVGGGFGGLANVTNADAPTRRDTPPHSFDADEGGAYRATAMTGQDDDAKYSDSLLKRVEVELVEDDIAEATQLVSSPNADAVKLKEEGNAALRRGDAESALRFYDASLELEPRNAIVLNNRAQAHSNLGKWENALKDTGKCLAIESGNTKALFRSGIAKLNLRPGDRSGIEDALADFQRAMSLNPPKNQVGLLAKKIADCKQLLASLSSRGGNASTKRRVTRDTDSLAF